MPNQKKTNLPRRRVIAICGNGENYDDILQYAEAVTINGAIALFPAANMLSDDWTNVYQQNPALYTAISRSVYSMQFDFIDMADILYVINPGGGIDDNTQKLVDYAEDSGVDIQYSHDYGDENIQAESIPTGFLTELTTADES